MNMFPVRSMLSVRSLALSFVMLTGLTISLSAPALAAESSASQQRQTVKTPALREKIYKVLSEAQAKAEDDQPAEAIKALDRLKSNSDLNSYEAAMMWKFYAYIYYSQDNHDKAIYSYEQLLKQDALPQALESEALYSAAQLYFVKEDYKKAISYLDRWFAMTESPKAQAYIMLGQAYFQMNQMDKALKPINTAITMTEKKGEVPKESWYLLQRALYFEQNNYKAGAQVLEKLVRHYPKKDYWVQLSASYGELKLEKKQLSTLEIAYRQGLLNKESELLTLAQLMIYADVPYKAAKVLELGMEKGVIKEDKDNLKLLSYAWSTAQEARKALPVLARAADSSESGEIDIQLGSTYYQLDEWDKAVASLQKGIKKGDVKKKDNAYMVLGLSLFNLNRFEDAQYAFKQAAKYEDSKAAANQWLDYVAKEVERRNLLAQTMEAMKAN